MKYVFYRLFKTIFSLGLVIAGIFTACAQPILTYAGNNADEVFYDVLQLSDGTFLVAGSAQNLNWIPAGVPQTQLTNTAGINNGLGTGKFGFILQLSSNMQQIVQAVHFAQGAVEDIRYLKTTNIPGQTTGALYLSGNTSDTKANNGGYFIAKLNHNFITGIPTALAWSKAVWAEGYPKDYHPWDVGTDEKVVYISGQSHAYDWSAVYRLTPNGQPDKVENWRTHWKVGGGEWRGTPASAYPGGADSIAYSGIVLKKWGRCDFRSWNDTDYNLLQPDGNGGTKKGLWPLDAFFNSPCNPAAPVDNGPGYTGYSTSGTPVHGGSVICIDRRNNHLYIGMNIKTVLPDGNPDFEPAVIAMTETGTLKWWSRLYHEIQPDGDYVVSTPDQYVDALAIDYSQPYNNGFLVVNARCHGNNTENFWEGNTLAANPGATGFQNSFTGSNGNIHISWLGKLQLGSGTIYHSTYVAEYAEGTGGLGAPHPNPNLANWPNPNSGWPDVNTTRLAKNNLKVSANGSVCIAGTGRRTITTANALQKMVLPANGGLSCWNSFVRVYTPDLSVPLYSSLVVGVWDTLTQAGGGNTDIYGIWKTEGGMVAVGRQPKDAATGLPAGNPIPATNVPAWGSALPSGESAVFAYLPAENLQNPADGYNANPPVTVQVKALLQGAYNMTTLLQNTQLRNNNLLPALQPFNTLPWNYAGTETAATLPANTVDWVLLEVYNPDMSLAETHAALLLNDGTLANAENGSTGVIFYNLTPGNSYYLALKPRNHLAVISANTVQLPNAAGYDFTLPGSAQNSAGNLVQVSAGKYALKAGDLLADGVITVADFNLYLQQGSATGQYSAADVNLDGNITIADFNLYQPNAGAIAVALLRY